MLFHTSHCCVSGIYKPVSSNNTTVVVCDRSRDLTDICILHCNVLSVIFDIFVCEPTCILIFSGCIEEFRTKMFACFLLVYCPIYLVLFLIFFLLMHFVTLYQKVHFQILFKVVNAFRPLCYEVLSPWILIDKLFFNTHP